MKDFWLEVLDVPLELVMSLIALVVSLFSASQARRSAKGAEISAEASLRSATAAEETVSLRLRREREEWIAKIAASLPDDDAALRLLETLPKHLWSEAQELIDAGAKRCSRLSYDRFEEYGHGRKLYERLNAVLQIEAGEDGSQ